LLVHGTTSDHATFDELVPFLRPARTVYLYDRRGRGRSGDADGPYRIDLEVADLIAVLDSIRAEHDEPVDLLSHSFGAFIALGALGVLGGRRDYRGITGLIAYSPGFGAAYPPGALDRVAEVINGGDPDAALSLVFREVIGMPDDDIQVLKDSPVWQARVSSAWSVVRECQADEAFLRDHQSTLGAIATPVLVLSGEVNNADKKDVAIRTEALVPGATLETLAGEGHAAHHTAPGALAEHSLAFFDRLRADEDATSDAR
jgi:pimeloyl-ACP methyl ester carboxylesterase